MSVVRRIDRHIVDFMRIDTRHHYGHRLSVNYLKEVFVFFSLVRHVFGQMSACLTEDPYRRPFYRKSLHGVGDESKRVTSTTEEFKLGPWQPVS